MITYSSHGSININSVHANFLLSAIEIKGPRVLWCRENVYRNIETRNYLSFDVYKISIEIVHDIGHYWVIMGLLHAAVLKLYQYSIVFLIRSQKLFRKSEKVTLS